MRRCRVVRGTREEEALAVVILGSLDCEIHPVPHQSAHHIPSLLPSHGEPSIVCVKCWSHVIHGWLFSSPQLYFFPNDCHSSSLSLSLPLSLTHTHAHTLSLAPLAHCLLLAGQHEGVGWSAGAHVCWHRLRLQTTGKQPLTHRALFPSHTHHALFHSHTHHALFHSHPPCTPPLSNPPCTCPFSHLTHADPSKDV